VKELQSALMTAISHNQTKRKLLDAARKNQGVLSMADAIAATDLIYPEEIQPILDSLIHSGYATLDQAPNGTALYNFKTLLSAMGKIIQVAKDKQDDLSVRECITATKLTADAVQIVLNALVEYGYATPMKDRYGTLYRVKNR
ncbi:MAG: hypothetical protein VKJ46_12470, partial [Leptolyngbyaceae bacterium]|nr:hypothetical protein [Leptolyngbyaceae bacterium]